MDVLNVLHLYALTLAPFRVLLISDLLEIVTLLCVYNNNHKMTEYTIKLCLPYLGSCKAFIDR